MKKQERLSLMNLFTPTTLVVVSVLATLLLASTTLVVRNGSAIVESDTGKSIANNVHYGDRAYRDVRGIPFVFLKRSIGDGECDIKDLRNGLCDPGSGNEPHQLLCTPLVVDMVFWFIVASLLTVASLRFVKVDVDGKNS